MAAIDAVEKCCISCKEVKPTTEFYKQVQSSPNGQKWGYYDSMCKSCKSKYITERRRKIKLKAIEYKGGKCVKCGYDNLATPEVFDFHHIDPSQKDFAIGSQVRKFETLKEELDKCVLLCANCHRIEHSVGYD